MVGSQGLAIRSVGLTWVMGDKRLKDDPRHFMMVGHVEYLNAARAALYCGVSLGRVFGD